jgi:uncharacterized membrane protein YhaH (DUF805 family)
MSFWAWLFSFEGRIGRGRYWALFLVYFGVYRLAEIAIDATDAILPDGVFGLIAIVFLVDFCLVIITLSWLFSLERRIGRARYWVSLLIYLGVGVLAAIAVDATDAIHRYGVLGLIAVVIVAALFLAMIISTVAVSAKRFHDRGKTAWLIALAFTINAIGEVIALSNGDPRHPNLIGVLISLGVSVWLLIDLGIMPGDKGPNRYGPGPRAEA